MKTLDDLKAALEGIKITGFSFGNEPVCLNRVAAQPGMDALSWLKIKPYDTSGLAGVVVMPHMEGLPRGPSFVFSSRPRLVFARVASRLFPPELKGRVPERSIGADGFGYLRNELGELERFPHYGKVLIGERVVIGHFTCIDRGALTDTIIEDGVKIDNLCHIAHGAHIGAHTSIAALSCIEGSVKIGKRCTIGSKVVFQIGSGCGDDVTVGSGSVVTKFIPDGETWIGSPARKLR